ncbi:MAG: acetyl-CoA hydrolase/transferase family protein [Actinomycetes bacterium]
MRQVSMEQMAAAVARSAGAAGRPRVVVSGNFATPWAAVDALDVLIPDWTLHMLNAQHGVPHRTGLRLETCFVGPGMRGQPTLSYVPSRLSMVPVLLRGPLAPDAAVVHVAPPRQGLFSMGTEVNILPAAVAAARARGGVVVAIVNPRMPYTAGDALLPADDVDLVVELEAQLPSPAAQAGVPDVQTQMIGEWVSARIPDGATVQAGIGAVPDAVLRGLGDRRGLRVWSEMVSDGVLDLEHSGALDPEAQIATSFLFGSQELYAWADGNPRLRMLSTQVANDPARIAANPRMVSVNTALEIDLFAQANAAHVRGQVYSGFGGQSDFVGGALHAKDGQAIIALRSWHPKADCSTIVPLLSEPVTSFQHTAIVTEHGTAELVGRDQVEQAAALIEHAADPRVRDELREEAGYLGLAATSEQGAATSTRRVP